jgi:hypothetical protein
VWKSEKDECVLTTSKLITNLFLFSRLAFSPFSFLDLVYPHKADAAVGSDAHLACEVNLIGKLDNVSLIIVDLYILFFITAWQLFDLVGAAALLNIGAKNPVAAGTRYHVKPAVQPATADIRAKYRTFIVEISARRYVFLLVIGRAYL